MKKSKMILLMAMMLMLTSCVALRESADTLQNNTADKTETDMPHGNYAKASEFERKTSDKAVVDETMSPIESVELSDPYAGVEISFLATGDNLIHPNIYTDAYYRRTDEKEYDFLPMYENVADAVREADIAFINQETVMAGEGYYNSGYPCFNSPQQLGVDLVELGFDVIGMANNHMLDMGVKGLSQTMDFWDQQPVTTIGAYRDEEDAKNIRVIEEEGVKIALLSYTYGTNGIVKPASSPIVIPYIDDSLIVSDLAAAEEIADFTIVSIHWGIENTQTPSDEQYRLAKLIADNGADIILGHHSHTIQPIEWVTAEDGREVLCIYSLGNLVSGMAAPVNQVGGFLTFDIESDGEGGLKVEDVLFTPTVFYYGMDWYSTKLYYLKDYTSDIASTHGVQISGYTLTPEKAKEFVTGTISAEFLPEYLKP